MAYERIFMPRVGAGQPARGQFQYAKPHRHEHLRSVVLAQLGIGRGQDLRRGAAQARPVIDDVLGRHHEQRRGHALVGHVRDDQDQVVVIHHEEIVEITADLLGRFHAGIEVEFRAIREGRELPGQRGALNSRSRVQLCFDALALRGDPGQLVGAVHNARLHRLYLMIQVADFVAGSNGQLDHIFPGEAFLSRREARGPLRQLVQGLCDQPSGQQHADRHRHKGERRDIQRAVHQKPVALLHHIAHVDVHAGQSRLPYLILPFLLDRRAGGAQPVLPGLIDGGGDDVFSGVLGEGVDGRLRRSDHQQALPGIHQGVGHAVHDILQVNVIDIKGIHHALQFIDELHVITVEAISFLLLHRRFIFFIVFRQIGHRRLRAHPILDDLRVVRRHGPGAHLAKFVRIHFFSQM